MSSSPLTSNCKSIVLFKPLTRSKYWRIFFSYVFNNIFYPWESYLEKYPGLMVFETHVYGGAVLFHLRSTCVWYCRYYSISAAHVYGIASIILFQQHLCMVLRYYYISETHMNGVAGIISFHKHMRMVLPVLYHSRSTCAWCCRYYFRYQLAIGE